MTIRFCGKKFSVLGYGDKIISGNIVYKGEINVPADFPEPTIVQVGWCYTIGTDVTDNDPTKTNTLQSFKAGDEIIWNGTNWSQLGVDRIWVESVGEITTLSVKDVKLKKDLYIAGKVDATRFQAGGAGINGILVLYDAVSIPEIELHTDGTKSVFPFGITSLPDGVDPTDAATVNQLDTHVHEDTKYDSFTITTFDEYQFILSNTPDLTAPFLFIRNANNVYSLGRGDFSVVGTTVTWNRNRGHGGDDSIPLSEGDFIDILYNIQNGTSANIANITEKGFGVNVKHIGENTWVSTSPTINVLWQVDDTEKVTYVRVSKNLPVNTEITPANSNLSHVIVETGYMVPHAGIVRQPFAMALQANVSIVRDGSTVTVENPGAAYINNGTEVLIQGVTPGDYNGTWTVTSIDPDNEKFTYDIGSATPGAVTVLGTTTFHYDPNPLLNNRTVLYEGEGKIILKDNILIPEGYNFDIIKKFGGGASVSIYPMGTVVVKGMYDNINNYKTWESISSTVPIIPSYGTVRLFYRGLEGSTPVWYIQYSPVTDETRV